MPKMKLTDLQVKSFSTQTRQIKGGCSANIDLIGIPTPCLVCVTDEDVCPSNDGRLRACVAIEA